MKRLIIAVLAAALALPAFAGNMDEADRLWSEGYFEDSLNVVNEALEGATGSEKAELLWRRSRAIHDLTGKLKRNQDKETTLEMYVSGQEAAMESLEIRPSAWAHYWLSANQGSWGDTKGILSSLDGLPDMEANLAAALAIDPDHGDSWSVLAIIDASVPGVMGGSIDDSVSLDRRAVDCWDGRGDIPLEWFGELVNHLYSRDFDADKRNRKLSGKEKKFNRTDDLVERHKSYEGTVDFSQPALYTDRPLSELSDRQECAQLLDWLIENLEGLPSITPYQQGKLDFFRGRRTNWDLL